jgi:hypothetical protein
MYILHIEHPVPDFEGWKRAFDNDPVARRKAGVRRYGVLRPVDDPNYVMIDLEFVTAELADAMLAALRTLWGSVEGTVMRSPKTRILEVVEAKEL